MSREARRLIRMYRRMTPAMRRDGARWYADARDAAQRLANRHGRSLEQVAAVIAVLSPSLSWDVNLATARRVLAGERHGLPAYPSNVAKAERILAGEAPYFVLRGPKVRAFFSLIVSAGRTRDVCVDGHAWNAAHGLRQSVRAAKHVDRHFDAVAGSYREAARALRVWPSALQATVWLAQRESR